MIHHVTSCYIWLQGVNGGHPRANNSHQARYDVPVRWDMIMSYHDDDDDETWRTLLVRPYESIILVWHGTQPMLVFCSICVWCIFCILLLGRWCPICDFPNADAVDGGNICIVSMAMLQHCIFYKLISISAKINWFIDLLLFYRNDLSRPSQH